MPAAATNASYAGSTGFVLTSCSVFADGFWEELSKYAEYREPDVLAILPQPQLSVHPVAPLRC